MNSIKFFFTSFFNEILKLKRTFAVWLCIISAGFIPLIYFIYYFLKHTETIPASGVNPWEKFLGTHLSSAIPFLVPLFVVIITSLVMQVEHKSEGIKQLFSLPIPKWSIYFGKLLVVIGIVLTTYLLFYLFTFLSGNLLGFLRPELKFLSFEPPYLHFFIALFRSFIAILGIIAIQFWLSFKLKNFIIPMGIGIVLVITGLTVYNAEEAIYFPYSYNLLNITNLNPQQLVWVTSISLYSLGFFVAAALMGYLHVRRMNIK